MPKEKKCKDCWKPRWHNLMYSRCKECQYKFVSSKPKKIYELKKTPVKKIWVKRKTRIDEKGSEYKVFVEIWTSRNHRCANCWWEIKFFHSSCFAHKLNKRDNQKLRYEKNNIALVHWVFEVKNEKTGETYNCHKEYDLKFSNWIKIAKIINLPFCVYIAICVHYS